MSRWPATRLIIALAVDAPTTVANSRSSRSMKEMGQIWQPAANTLLLSGLLEDLVGRLSRPRTR